jgi:hypothetical protein
MLSKIQVKCEVGECMHVIPASYYLSDQDIPTRPAPTRGVGFPGPGSSRPGVKK